MHLFPSVSPKTIVGNLATRELQGQKMKKKKDNYNNKITRGVRVYCTLFTVWPTLFYSIPTHGNQTEVGRNNSLVPCLRNECQPVCITVMETGNMTNGDSVIKVYCTSPITNSKTQTTETL